MLLQLSVKKNILLVNIVKFSDDELIHWNACKEDCNFLAVYWVNKVVEKKNAGKKGHPHG